MADTDIVYFNLPGGGQVTNDPRAAIAEQARLLLEATPNRGHAALDEDELRAASFGTGISAPQSGIEGVGEAATGGSTLDGRIDGQKVQLADADRARTLGLTANTPGTEPAIDANEEVLTLRENKAPVGDDLTDKPYSEWPPKALAIAVRERQLKVEGKLTKAKAIAALEAADAAGS